MKVQVFSLHPSTLEEAVRKWLMEKKDIRIYSVTQSESTLRIGRNVTLTIFYKEFGG